MELTFREFVHGQHLQARRDTQFMGDQEDIETAFQNADAETAKMIQ